MLSDHNAITAIRSLIHIFEMSPVVQQQLVPMIQPLFGKLLEKFPKKNNFMAFVYGGIDAGGIRINYIDDICRQEGFSENVIDTYYRENDYTKSEIKPKLYKIKGILDKLRQVISQSLPARYSRSSRSLSRGGKNRTKRNKPRSKK